MIRPIAISLSPNMENKDVLLALKLLFTPWSYKPGNCVKKLEHWFCKYFNVSFAVSFASGRAAFLAILKSLTIGKGDEVIVQSFTCSVVPDAVIETGAIPIFVDIKNSLTIDPFDLKKKITKNTKVIVLQHTFGIPSDIDEILKIAKKNNIAVIEDCAHTIGGTYNGKKLGSFGIASFFSLGREKAFSSVFGGVAITNEKMLGKKITELHKCQKNPSFFWIMQQLFHPIAFFIILPVYNFFSFGKIILVAFQKLKMLSFPISKEERSGKISENLTKKLPNALACLALFQLERIDKFNKKRETISKLYIEKFTGSEFNLPYKNIIPFLRFPVLLENRDEILAFFKKRGIYLGNWYSNVIDPKGVNMEKIFYKLGSCPNSEKIARKIINLPTYPTMSDSDVRKILKLFNKLCLK
ncbi:MAG: aminotransferase class I/II-fold pyridoxal phosphate-dependent enzyme [Candidatus Levybacteria bacterium]|nr:aminotransferase class I/II-fold pyridoxal phosphate-dependent enzyme [Candidatus Levybacteria bacterium]